MFELQDASSVIDKASQKTFIGGGSGSSSDPYTQDEFDSMMYSGHWNGGFVYVVEVAPFGPVVVGLVVEAMQVVTILIIIATIMDIMVTGGIMVIPIIMVIRDFMVIIFMEVVEGELLLRRIMSKVVSLILMELVYTTAFLNCYLVYRIKK